MIAVLAGALTLSAPAASAAAAQAPRNRAAVTAAATLATSVAPRDTSLTGFAVTGSHVGAPAIAPLPPTIDTVSPSSGLTTGGTTVTITGTGLDTVQSILIGSITLGGGDFTVNADGTSLSFVTPPADAEGPVDITLTAATATAVTSFDYTNAVIPPATPPGAPTALVAVGGDGSIAVTFTPPTDDGGSAITDYQVSTDGGVTWNPITTTTGAAGTRTATVTGLTNGVTYPVTVRAVNVRAAGTAADPVSATPLAPVIAPGAPTALVAVGGDGSIAVTFTPPTDDGGSAITDYQVSTDGGVTWNPITTTTGPAGTRTATVTGLTNGVTYPVTVRAVNVHGPGMAAAPDHARPSAPTITAPGAPTHVNALGRDRRIAVTFTPPVSTGTTTPITAYQVSIDRGHTWRLSVTRAGPHGTRTATVTGVRNGVLYRVTVRAVTVHGVGPAAKANGALPNAKRLGPVRHGPASEVAIPKHPNNYYGPRVNTRARNTSHNGTWAHSIRHLGARQLTKGEAATLSKWSLFGWDSATLTKAVRHDVRALAGHLLLARRVTCEGYTDYAGQPAHEKSISQRRAHAVCTALKHYGAKVRTRAHGYGGARPVVIGGQAHARAANRRVVVIVTR